jgi:hypothetical protein
MKKTMNLKMKSNAALLLAGLYAGGAFAAAPCNLPTVGGNSYKGYQTVWSKGPANSLYSEAIYGMVPQGDCSFELYDVSNQGQCEKVANQKENSCFQVTPGARTAMIELIDTHLCYVCNLPSDSTNPQ